MEKTIELINCESHDWQILKVDGEVIMSDHTISEFYWLKLLEELGCIVKTTTVSNEEIEEMC